MKYYFSVVIWFSCMQLAFGQEQFPSVWKELKKEATNVEQSGPFYLLSKSEIKALSVTGDAPTVVRKLDHQYYVVKQATASQSSQLKWAVNNQWKVSENINTRRDHVKDTYFVRTSCTSALAGSPKLNIKPASHLSSVYEVEGKLKDVLDQYLNNDCVIYIGKEALQPTTDARVLDLNLTYNKVTTAKANYPQLDGSGVIVSVKENQYDEEDIDLLGKGIPSGIESSNVDSHATDMATIIGGKGNSSVRGTGVAPAVMLTSSDFSDIIPDTDEEYERLNVLLQNHSYGTVVEHFYGTLAEAYDASSYRNPGILHVFSAGNFGRSTNSEGLYQGIPFVANLTGNFKGAKNTLTVGSVDTVGNAYIISSRGPTYDGRVKPELVTYSMFGTSNSAAIVTGISVLVHQAYEETFGDRPSSALVKALLINSATDADAPGVDFNTGFGAVNADRAVRNTLAGQFMTDEVVDGSSRQFALNIPDNAVNLKVTLVWTDSAAMAGDVSALVNDLDLTLSSGTETWLPWVLDSSRKGIRLAPTRKEDHLNNVEQITIDNPMPGSYQVSVSGFDVASSSQPFAIAYQYDTAGDFAWSYPLGGDNVPFDGEVIPYLQWESTFSDGTTASLEYTIDDGQTWHLIEEEVLLERGFFRWSTYPRDLHISRLRMMVDGVVFASEDFTLSSPKSVELGFDCGDSLLFFWNRDALAMSYNIFNLQNTNLTLVDNITDTSLLVKKADLATSFLSVEPVLANNQTSLKSETFNYLLQGGSCYFNSIFPNSFPEENRIALTANISTNYLIETIGIERKNNEEFEEIGTVTPSSLEFQFNDLDPLQGINIYRAVAVLSNGERVVSDETEVFFLTTTPVQVFPNPVERPGVFSVFTRDLDGTSLKLYIYNYSGQLIFDTELLGDRSGISTAGFSEGIYLYRVVGEGVDETGRLVVE